MNILYFSFEFPPYFVGGLGTYAYEMSRRFARLGHSVTLFAMNPGDATTTDLVEGVEVHRPLLADATDLLPCVVPEDIKYWPPKSQRYFADVLMYNILSATKAVNLLVGKNNRKFDLIVSHDWLGSMAGIICKRMLQLPFILHLHSIEEGRSGDGSVTIKSLEKQAGKIADRIITVSYAMRDQLVSLGYQEAKIRVVYNGIDEQKYSPERIPEEKIKEFRDSLGIGNDPLILFVGRLAWIKGADVLVRAMPLILREVPNAKLLILGKGDQEGMIKDMVEHMGLQKSVILEYRYVKEEDRILRYAACDVAVFPSKYEPFGLVCTEAMSMGKPVVVGARGVSGMREQVVPWGPDRCGAHVNPDDPSDIAKFVIEILKDDALRRQMGKNARKRVLEKFSIQKIAEETAKVYEETIQEFSRG